jgi:hypothetical protein
LGRVWEELIITATGVLNVLNAKDLLLSLGYTKWFRPWLVVKFVGSVAGARLSNAAIFLQTLNILVHHVHL